MEKTHKQMKLMKEAEEKYNQQQKEGETGRDRVSKHFGKYDSDRKI